MEVITLEKGLKVYHFNKEEKGEFVSYNLIVIEDKEDVLLVDTAFRRHFNQLEADLQKQNKKITTVITTHHHRDHIGGLSKLREAKRYASIHSEITLKKVFKKEDYSKYMPNILVTDETITFGDFKIAMYQNPGHSVDGLLVVINDKYIMVGDEMIYDLKGKELLPFASEGDLNGHINSLRKIMSFSENGVIIPTHGPILKDNKYFIKDIQNRIMYFKYKKQHPDSNHDDFYKETGVYFLGHEWYKNNV